MIKNAKDGPFLKINFKNAFLVTVRFLQWTFIGSFFANIVLLTRLRVLARQRIVDKDGREGSMMMLLQAITTTPSSTGRNTTTHPVITPIDECLVVFLLQ